MRDRRHSSCGLILDKDGQPLVAIIGGLFSDQKGMEIWNPRTNTVDLLWDVIPPEVDGSLGLQDSQVVSLKGGQELLMYGGYQGSYQDGIWKYVAADDTWKRYSVSSFQFEFLDSYYF